MVKLELLKMAREKSIYFLFVLLSGILLVPLFLSNGGESYKVTQYESRLKNNQSDLVAINNDPKAKKVIEEIEQENIYYQDALAALKANDEEALVHAEYNLENTVLSSMKSGSLIGTPQIEQERRIQELEYLITHNIKQVDYTTNRIPAINYIYYILADFLPYMYFLFVPIIVIANFATFEKRKKTIDFFNVSPVSSAKKLLTKLLLTTGGSLLLVYLSLFVSFVVSLVKNGLGAKNYPVVKLLAGGSLEIISITTFIFQALLLFSLLVIFFALFSFVLSLFTGNIIINIFVLISIVFVSDLKLTSSKYSITNLIDFPKIVSGGTTYEPPPNPELTFGFSAITLVCYIAVFSLLIGFTLRMKKGMI